MYNHLHHDSNEKTHMEKFSHSNNTFDLKIIHAFGFLVHVLDHLLQNGENILRWEPRCRLGIFFGNSLLHSDNVALALNSFVGLVCTQHHVAFGHQLHSLSSLRSGTIPSNWEELYKNYRFHVSRDDASIDLSSAFPSIYPSSEISENEGEYDYLQVN